MKFNHIELSEKISVLIPIEQRYGNSNIGMFNDHEGLLLYDVGPTPAAAHAASLSIQELHNVAPKQAIFSSARAAHSGGSQTFWQAAFYGSADTSRSLDQPLNNATLKNLLPHFSEQYEPETFQPRTVSHIITKAIEIRESAFALPLPGDSIDNLALYLQDDKTIFLGALASFGVTPLGFSADFPAWCKTLEEIQELDCKMFVPGHGPPGGKEELAVFVDYLKSCIEARGIVENLKSGPWSTWHNPEFHRINIEQADKNDKGDKSIPEAMIRLVEDTSRLL